MNRYVCGFMFDGFKENVVLIKKNRPEWQAGFLNGVGGKIEDGESPVEAMGREFCEEAGIPADDTLWHHFCTLHGGRVGGEPIWQVYFFTDNCGGAYTYAHTKTNEEIVKVPTSRLPTNVVPNLRWLIPMAKNGFFHNVYETTYVD